MSEQHPGAQPPPRHELRDISFRAVMAGGLAIGLAVGGLVVVADMLFPQKSLDRLLKPPFPVIAEPRLQSDPAADMAAFAAHERDILNSSGWTDRDRGIGHIPIAQAMQDIADEGIPGWPTGEGVSP
ncbi:hypothetical protein NO263_17045 [Gluconacetobacter entanii]|uniref:Uncharacterized protein n=2 Tax=Gluconacetobacter entanii TaxID=108528 RepID=A0ABT3KA28_9PROT|nr:hypothetical protein [Gluconacetobacter entanii]MCE2577898.1 hypothetical protein [Komagataeibacter sp. FNDCR1]MCW4592295.1 hypothetical protein [Gluconacetobacter entanii]MCW4595696.1 hypothetical protein [Gluconacetobacter entanii]